MKESRLGAVDHIRIEAPLGVEEALRWFYTEVAGLEEVAPKGDPTRELAFKSAMVELRIKLTEEPVLERQSHRLTISVPSLEASVELLEEHKIDFERLTGLGATDRRIGTSDPGGNRIALKQQWPYAPL